MDSEVLIYILSVFGGLIATLGAILVFTIKYTLKRSREDVKLANERSEKQMTALNERSEKIISSLVESFNNGTKQFENAIESIEVGHQLITGEIKASKDSIMKLRLSVKKLREELKCA